MRDYGADAEARSLDSAGGAVDLPGRLWAGHPLVQIPGLVLLTVAEGFLRFGLLQLFHLPASFGELLLYVILPQALFNGFLGAACVLAVEAAYALRRRQTWI